MKIDTPKPPENEGQCGAKQVQKPAAEEPRNAAPEVRKAKPSDKMDISSGSKDLSKIMSAVNQLPDVREARVVELKKSIESGSYTVDPRKVAEKLLQEI